jgi:Cytochrome P460
MKRFATPLIALTVGLTLGLAGCSDDGDTTTPELVSEFTGYTDFIQVEYTNAPSPFLGPAHQGNNPEYARAIYSNEAGKVEGDYPVGTIFVKETFTYDDQGDHVFPEAMGLLGLVKREAGFDTEGGDWEFFVIDPADLSTIDSGANIGSCKGCHTNATGANGNDHIFAHPYEYEAVAADFDSYTNWNLIGTEQGPDALIGDAHAGNNADAVRSIYKKQLAAKPIAGTWSGYPVGTLFLKAVHDGDQNLIGMTAMAKRGGDHDSEHGGWEYFMMDMESETLMPMGENSGMCIGCHTGANSGGNGMDYVFAHEGDPFNN